jgi:hypothetical protein
VADQGLELHVDVGLHGDAEAAELFDATSQLQQDLLQLDVASVARPAGPPPPPGTRGVEIAELASLIVALGADVIGPVAQCIASWVVRGSSRTVKLEIGGDSIEVTGLSREKQDRLIESFLVRHAAISHDSGS